MSFRFRNKQEQIIWLFFWCAVFVCLMFFFQKYHPLTIFDTDDWTYVKFTRRSGGIFPSTKEYNPIKVLPENMTAVAGFFGAYVVKPFCGDYVRSIEISYGLFLCITITVYLYMLVAAVASKIILMTYKGILLGVFTVLIHFLPLCTKMKYVKLISKNTNGC